MSRFGVDEDWQRLTAGELLAAGRSFAVGYVSEDTTGKNITSAEVDAYLAAGVSVLLVYEYSTTAIAGGASKGTRDAGIAIAAARTLGYPAGCVIAFAVDQDTSSNPAAVDGYARAFTAACHAAGYRSMDYGGLATVKRCADLGLTDLHWQTYAWSGSPTVWDPRAAIRQVRNGAVIAGKQVDLDVAQVDDFGAWTGAAMADSDIVLDTHRRVTNVDEAYLGHGLALLQDPVTVIAPDGTPVSYPFHAATVLKDIQARVTNPPPAVVTLTPDQITAIAAQVAAAVVPLITTPAAATVDELARRLGNG